MRVIVIVRAKMDSETGVIPGEKRLADMGKFNDEPVKAGFMPSADSLHTSSNGGRFAGGKTIIDGAFAETKDLAARDSIQQVNRSRKRAGQALPRSKYQNESEIEIRPVFEAEDFGKGLTPGLRVQTEAVYAEASRQRKSQAAETLMNIERRYGHGA